MEIKSKEIKEIICFNCERIINIEDMPIGAIFKCKKCYTTLIVTSYFQELRNKFILKRNRWLMLGLAIGLFPMIFFMAFVTTKPVLIVSFYLLVGSLIILSVKYFMKRAADILIGIIFAEIGIYANLTRMILIYFPNPKYIKTLPELDFQIYFFLIIGSFLIAMGLYRRSKYLLK